MRLIFESLSGERIQAAAMRENRNGRLWKLPAVPSEHWISTSAAATTAESARSVEASAHGAVSDVDWPAREWTRSRAPSRPAKHGMNVRAVVPRTSSNEGAANKPARAIEPSRSASVGGIWVVAVCANGSWPHIRRSSNNWRTKTDTHDNSLGMSVGSNHQTEAKYGKNSQVSHVVVPSESLRTSLALGLAKTSIRLPVWKRARSVPSPD